MESVGVMMDRMIIVRYAIVTGVFGEVHSILWCGAGVTFRKRTCYVMDPWDGISFFLLLHVIGEMALLCRNRVLRVL